LRSFFAGGVVKMRVSWAVESLSVLVHLSLFLFFSGLIIFLHNVNQNVCLSVIWCVGIFLTVYGCFTIMPMFLPESPYNTPLTLPAVVIVCITGYIVCTTLICALYYCVLPLALLFYLLYKLPRFFCGIRSCFRNRLGPCLEVRNGGTVTPIRTRYLIDTMRIGVGSSNSPFGSFVPSLAASFSSLLRS
jgi:hypothetical protein